MKKSILLISGLVLTLLYIVFSMQIYEAIYYEREFSDEMYNQNLYLISAFVSAIVAWGWAGIYYYLINSVSFSRWYHWLLMLAIAMIVSALINYFYPLSIFSENGLSFTHQLVNYSLVTAMLTAILFVIASFSMRWWSTNCRHTPIPE